LLLLFLPFLSFLLLSFLLFGCGGHLGQSEHLGHGSQSGHLGHGEHSGQIGHLGHGEHSGQIEHLGHDGSGSGHDGDTGDK